MKVCVRQNSLYSIYSLPASFVRQARCASLTSHLSKRREGKIPAWDQMTLLWGKVYIGLFLYSIVRSKYINI